MKKIISGIIMKIYSFLLALIIIALQTSSCSTNSNKYYAIKNTSPRISTLGFYISPPPGKNWYEKHSEASLFYFKRTAPETYALTTEATELFFKDVFDIRKDFLEYVKSKKDPAEISDQLRNCTSNYTLEESPTRICVHYQHRYDDYGLSTKGNHPFVSVFNKGLVCINPKSPQVGIDVNYMEKSIPENTALSYRDEGETFISSLNFYKTSKY